MSQCLARRPGMAASVPGQCRALQLQPALVARVLQKVLLQHALQLQLQQTRLAPMA